MAPGGPSVFAAAALIYAYARHTQGPYLNAKPLAAMAPLAMLVLIAPLLDWARRWPTLTLDGAARRLLLVGFTVLAAYCTLDVLDDARVGPLQHAQDLMRLRPLVKGHATLFLPEDHYVNWELAGAKLSYPSVWSIPSNYPLSPRKGAVGAPVDFDAVDAATLDHFEYVVTTRGEAQSQAPANWHLVAQTQWYDLYHRVGPTAARQILEPTGQPGAVLDCRTPTGLGWPPRLGSRPSGKPPTTGRVGAECRPERPTSSRLPGRRSHKPSPTPGNRRTRAPIPEPGTADDRHQSRPNVVRPGLSRCLRRIVAGRRSQQQGRRGHIRRDPSASSRQHRPARRPGWPARLASRPPRPDDPPGAGLR